jgi:hypothetical protein
MDSVYVDDRWYKDVISSTGGVQALIPLSIVLTGESRRVGGYSSAINESELTVRHGGCPLSTHSRLITPFQPL